MQTFLPHADFVDSAACLDQQRLGKQRVEAYQILLVLTGRSEGWKNHPAVKMWHGHTPALIDYALTVIAEWKSRGYKDNLAPKIIEIALSDNIDLEASIEFPAWLGNEEFHALHRSNLLRKNAAHYGQFGWGEAANLEYVWPTSSLLPQPPRESTMSDEKSKKAEKAAPAAAADAPAAVDPTTNPPVIKVVEEPTVFKRADELIRATISEVLNAIDPKIGEKNLGRATKRLGNIAKNTGIALGRLEKQTKRANRVKRVKKEKKVKEAPAAGGTTDAAAPAPNADGSVSVASATPQS